jgi:hypothetical protein
LQPCPCHKGNRHDFPLQPLFQAFQFRGSSPSFSTFGVNTRERFETTD